MNQFTGSNFNDFLEEEGILEEVSAKAHKRLLALQHANIMKENSITKTSCSQLDRILDPDNTTITIP